MLLGCDLSHHNDVIDWDALAAALKTADGAGFVVHKATEGAGFTDDRFEERRDAAEARALGFGAYHFARLGSVSAEAAKFLAVFGAPRPGEFVNLDLEVSAPGVDPVAWSAQWLDAIAQVLGFEPLIYLNKAELAGLNWSPVLSRGAGLWLAAYDRSTSPVPSGPWSTLAIKQFDDQGEVAGVGGLVDRDVFFGDAAALARYGFHGNVVVPPAHPTPAPQPAPAPRPAGSVLGLRLVYGQRGAAVARLQAWLARNFPGYRDADHLAALPATGFYGEITTAWVRDFAHRCGIASADGRNVGPQIAAALAAHGYRG